MVVSATVTPVATGAPAAIPLSNLPSLRNTVHSAGTVATTSQNTPPNSQPQSQVQSQSQSLSLSLSRTTTAATRPANVVGNTLPLHQNPLTWRDRVETAFSLSNGLGTIMLILAVVFGIGAWVGMNIQISQGGKSLELTIWATCADHETIQKSQLCQSILSKDFNDFQKRDGRPSTELAIVVKRDEVGDVEVVDAPVVYQQETPYSKLLSTLSDYERAMVDVKEPQYSARETADPALRATIFPLVDMLTVPVRWFFALIETILLIAISSIHKVFSWLSWIVICAFQCICYSFLEGLVKQCLVAIDMAIMEALPSWAPSILFSNLASLVGLSFLRSYWYGVSWSQSLKWIFIFRLAMWLIVEGAKLGYHLWSSWRVNLERRHLQRDLRDAMQSAVGGAGTRSSYVF